MRRKLKNIAHKIVDLEKRAQTEPNFDYASEMEALIKDLDMAELIDIDEYINKENLLTN